MSIEDERNLAERFGRAVGTIIPSGPPVDGAMRRGRTIRRRRQLATAAGLAAVAAGAVAAPSLSRGLEQQPPVTAAPHAETVQAPGPNPAAGLVASGTVSGRRWQLVVGRPGAGGARPGQQFVLLSGPAFGPATLTTSGPVLGPDPASPISFITLASAPVQTQYGAVRPDVSYATVRMGDGTVLTLTPEDAWGTREVAFVVPLGAEITEVTAYGQHGQIATAVPFNYPGGMATFGAWLAPGQHGLSRATGRVTSGLYNGHTWSVTAYLGPWGSCLESRTEGVAGDCRPATSALDTELLFRSTGAPEIAGGTAAATVVQVVADLPDGSTIRVTPVTVGGQKFFAFPVPAGRQPLLWRAYDSAGSVVTSGTA